MKAEKIKVLALLPTELPKEIELDNTLEAMQKFVGGLIECITLSDTGSAVTLVCNDEGKLLGLPLNRPLWDRADVLAGPGFLAGCDNEGNLTSLPQSTMDFYKEKFRAFIIEIYKSPISEKDILTLKPPVLSIILRKERKVMIDKQQDFLTLTGAARRARSEGYDITYHSLRNLVAAGYISHVPNGLRIYVFYPNVIRFLQKGLTAEQSLDYQLSRARN